ncbi:hypothetical protein GGF32_005330 [Allomyces javanicus]|nr:hypothetical protein GGF32_005330 [Allomyces javanicus]
MFSFLGLGKKEEPKHSIVLDSQTTEDAGHVGGFYPVFSGGAKKRKSKAAKAAKAAKKSSKRSKRRSKRKSSKRAKRHSKRKSAGF